MGKRKKAMKKGYQGQVTERAQQKLEPVQAHKPMVPVPPLFTARSVAEDQLFDDYHTDSAHDHFDDYYYTHGGEYGYFDDDVDQMAVMHAQIRNTYGQSALGIRSIDYDALVLGSVLAVVITVCMLACCATFIIVAFVGWKHMRFGKNKRDLQPLERDELV